MIQGSVKGLQARINVQFRIPRNPLLSIEFVIDTGFEGALALPTAAVTALALPSAGRLKATLADGSEVEVAVYRATIRWDGHELNVAVLAMGRRPLLGTALLDGFNLNADFADNGPIALTRLP